MNKLVFATQDYKPLVESELYNKFKRIVTSEILFGGGIAMPRNQPSDFHAEIQPVPDTTGSTDISFADATNQRVNDIIAYAETNDLPIVVMWSGGIDSTALLSAIIKHFPNELMSRVVVQLTNASYFENPYFFKNIILKNRIAFVTDAKYDYNNAIILHGEPADALWVQSAIIYINIKNPDAYKQVLAKDNTILMETLIEKSDPNYAEWIYNYIIDSAKLSNLEIETINDFYWWLIFNFNYNTMCNKHIGESLQPINSDSYAIYNKNFFPWYDTTEYQTWSIQSQKSDIKYDGTVRSYKMPAKEYIFDLDKNQYYRDYKTKVLSRYQSMQEEQKVLALFEDGEIILNA